MSNTDVYSAIERIRTDETFARQLAEEGATALVPFNLSSDEQTAIVLAFQQDLDAEFDDVVGFASLSFGGMQFTNLVGLQGAATSADAKGDYFLKLDGIDGESKDDTPRGELL